MCKRRGEEENQEDQKEETANVLSYRKQSHILKSYITIFMNIINY